MIAAAALSGFLLAPAAGAGTAYGAVTTPDQKAVLATVRQFIDGINGDFNKALAVCASPAIIIDEFAPHVWRGATACADWYDAFNADAGKHGITDSVVTLGTPWHVDITGGTAYVVSTANYTYKQSGKPVSEIGSVFTVALVKAAAGWRVTGWAWAKH
ncbi:MAG: nuclear transport factor 2 family protein [Candidatus Eremiobacteraeota bacterium]|nr:nuclear transport factor 2 family protein [Candidatus Eremiobacteraeota bacterium]